jgi:signal transduction histidine kinase
MIEDSKEDSEMVVRELARAGISTETARVETSQTLAEALEKGPWDLVLCDSSMPHLTCGEALALVRAAQGPTAFAFLSGNPGAEPRGVRVAGALASLDKRNPAELVALAERVLAGNPGASRPSGPILGPSGAEPGHPLSRPRILLVDDQPENLLTLETVLEDLPADLVRAASGDEALARLLESEYALILLDVRMPGMTGLETAEIFRKRERTRSVPVIFLTAGTDDTDVARGYAAGGVDYLVKPFVPEVLRAKVSVFLELWRKGELLKRQAAELRTANQSLEAFSGSAAHDLRAPLRTIVGFSLLLSDEYAGKVLDDEGQSLLAKIREAGSRMDTLIRDLLAYSRVGAQEFQPIPVDLTPLIEDVLSGLSSEITRTGALVTVDGPLGVAAGQALLLRQAAENLISNALKFVPPGRSPEVRIRSELRSGKRLRLWVEDKGIGICESGREHLFQPFHRLDTAHPYAGTGLGLAIAKRSLERMGGAVGFESEVEKGSRFYIELPSMNILEAGRQSP